MGWLFIIFTFGCFLAACAALAIMFAFALFDERSFAAAPARARTREERSANELPADAGYPHLPL